ncbi:hypothetical protein [Paraburkholderia dinghuensis]|uniref:Uncharacterized protein n=1 Tax=Paraburkholderia dinghuensis TaxID=2305225 RepID=A0A3N6NDC6_9BURK|nr:hypothetical protein [Paraburkholderia dinghuensis]RQH06497.1 hypothetical protein D1Y85_11490 [Paraburkholderia dinghuensis]
MALVGRFAPILHFGGIRCRASNSGARRTVAAGVRKSSPRGPGYRTMHHFQDDSRTPGHDFMKPLFFSAPGALLALMLAVGVPASAEALTHTPVSHRAATLDQNAPAFAVASVHAIAGTWNPREMMTRAAPEIMTPFVQQELPNAYARLNAKLGKLTTLSAPVSDNGPPLPGKDPMANPMPVTVPVPRDGMVQRYLFNAQFQAGAPARIEIVLRYREKWQIVGLHVDSPMLH